MFVAQTYELPPLVNYFGKGTTAEIQRSSTLEGEGNGPRMLTESWSVTADNGDSFLLSLHSQHGKLGWSSGEALVHGVVEPDFRHIYRYDQLIELFMSNAIGLVPNGEISFSASGPEVFDGTEVLQAATVIPV